MLEAVRLAEGEEPESNILQAAYARKSRTCIFQWRRGVSCLPVGRAEERIGGEDLSTALSTLLKTKRRFPRLR